MNRRPANAILLGPFGPRTQRPGCRCRGRRGQGTPAAQSEQARTLPILYRRADLPIWIHVCCSARFPDSGAAPLSSSSGIGNDSFSLIEIVALFLLIYLCSRQRLFSPIMKINKMENSSNQSVGREVSTVLSSAFSVVLSIKSSFSTGSDMVWCYGTPNPIY